MASCHMHDDVQKVAAAMSCHVTGQCMEDVCVCQFTCTESQNEVLTSQKMVLTLGGVGRHHHVTR